MSDSLKPPAARTTWRHGNEFCNGQIIFQQNDLLTRIGPGAPAGKLMRMYWQPAALVEEMEGPRPIKPLREAPLCATSYAARRWLRMTRNISRRFSS